MGKVMNKVPLVIFRSWRYVNMIYMRGFITFCYFAEIYTIYKLKVVITKNQLSFEDRNLGLPSSASSRNRKAPAWDRITMVMRSIKDPFRIFILMIEEHNTENEYTSKQIKVQNGYIDLGIFLILHIGSMVYFDITERRDSDS